MTGTALKVYGLSRDQYHRYTANYPDTGLVGPLVGVTTPLKLQDTMIGGDLPAWGARTALDYLLAHPDPLSLQTRSEAMQAITAARDIGTEVHAQVEKILKREPVLPTERTAPFIYAFSSFLANERPEFVEVEAMVANLKAGFAGTFDFAAKLRGRMACVDVKTGKLKSSHRLQLAGYTAPGNFIGREGDPQKYPLPKFRDFYVLLLRPGEYELVELPVTAADRRHFLALVKAYREIRAWNEAQA